MNPADPSRRRLTLLGPQPHYQTLVHALAELPDAGPTALITAGWEEDESVSSEAARLLQMLPPGSVNLELYRRADELFEQDHDLIDLLRRRQDHLRHLREVYCQRLDQILEACRITVARKDPLLDLSAEQEQAIDMVRQLDRQYLLRTGQICDEFDDQLKLGERPQVRQHRMEIAESLDRCGAIAISGGHAAIILNRLRIFSILQHEKQHAVVAWSGGAMAISGQIVLFHDSPPQGRGNAEVLRAGMGLYEDLLPLPAARKRLLLDDPLRVSMFARRFEDWPCVVLDETARLNRIDGNWQCSEGTRKLGVDGKLLPMKESGSW